VGYLSKLSGGARAGRSRKGGPSRASRRGRAGDAGQLTIFGD
jgi:hypothetical protein